MRQRAEGPYGFNLHGRDDLATKDEHQDQRACKPARSADETSALREDRNHDPAMNPGLFFGGLSPYDDPIITDDLP